MNKHIIVGLNNKCLCGSYRGMNLVTCEALLLSMESIRGSLKANTEIEQRIGEHYRRLETVLLSYVKDLDMGVNGAPIIMRNRRSGLFTINGKPCQASSEYVTYNWLVWQAGLEGNPDVTFFNGHPEHPEGCLRRDGLLRVHPGMVIDICHTNNA